MPSKVTADYEFMKLKIAGMAVEDLRETSLYLWVANAQVARMYNFTERHVIGEKLSACQYIT